MSRLALTAWSAEALVASLRLAILLGQYQPANDNGADVCTAEKGGRHGSAR